MSHATRVVNLSCGVTVGLLVPACAFVVSEWEFNGLYSMATPFGRFHSSSFEDTARGLYDVALKQTTVLRIVG